MNKLKIQDFFQMEYRDSLILFSKRGEWIGNYNPTYIPSKQKRKLFLILNYVILIVCLFTCLFIEIKEKESNLYKNIICITLSIGCVIYNLCSLHFPILLIFTTISFFN